MGGPRFLAIDEIAALVVVAVIVTSGTRLLWSSAQELMDAQAAGAFVDQIRGAAAAVPGVKRIDKLWVRKSGLEYLVDIHIQVRADQTVDEGHRISHLVKDELLNRFANLRDVLVHLEPYPHVHDSGDKLYSEETERVQLDGGETKMRPVLDAAIVFGLSLSAGLASSRRAATRPSSRSTCRRERSRK